MKMQILANTAVRASAVLTTSYVASTKVDVGNANQVAVYLDFTKGSLTTAELKFQFTYKDNPATAANSTDWFDYAISNTAVGTTSGDEFLSPLRSFVQQLDTTCTKVFFIPVKGRKFRVLAKGTGTVTSSLLALTCVVGVA